MGISTKQLICNFLDGKIKSDPSCSMKIKGDRLYSYSRIIAYRKQDVVIVNDAEFSRFTDRHRTILYEECSRRELITESISDNYTFLDRVKEEESKCRDPR